MTGPYSVVLLCDCRTRHGCGYIVRHVTRPEAEARAADFARTNHHAVMIVLSNELDDPPQYYRPTSTAATGANRP